MWDESPQVMKIHDDERLASEKSPYLRQHAHKPVDWDPRGEEGFAKARGEDSRSFCRWPIDVPMVPVMAHESLRTPGIAKLLTGTSSPSGGREERPDSTAVPGLCAGVVTRGGGGWRCPLWRTPG
jgi:uncharacterized protein YyaL (SSP411 family)